MLQRSCQRVTETEMSSHRALKMQHFDVEHLRFMWGLT